MLVAAEANLKRLLEREVNGGVASWNDILWKSEGLGLLS